MLADHVNISLKRGVKILTCNPQSRLIEAETRNAEVITVNAYYYTPVFRWPVPGEKWVVREENGSWFLDGIYEQQEPSGKVSELEDGDAIISTGSGRVLKNVNGQLELFSGGGGETHIFHVSNAPSESLGVEGDWALSQNGHIYFKATAWEQKL